MALFTFLLLSTPSITTVSLVSLKKSDELPELYTFIFMCYSNSSFLNFGEHLQLSNELSDEEA